MRTTIRLDDSLLAEAKYHAARTGRTLTAVIEDALRASLAVQAQAPGTEGWTKLPTVDGQGLRPGVDLDSTSDLIDIMERDDPR
jgi:hypothetical protein